MMVVTHEMGFARKVAHRVIFMDHGEIVEDAPGGAILRRAGQRAGQELSWPASSTTEPRPRHGPSHCLPKPATSPPMRASPRRAACRWWCSTAARIATGARRYAASISARWRATRGAGGGARTAHGPRHAAGRLRRPPYHQRRLCAQMQAKFAPTVMFHGPDGTAAGRIHRRLSPGRFLRRLS
jgi:hypothetical protein